MKRLTIGSRGSQLALWQARHVRQQLLQRQMALDVQIQVIRTTGDKLTQVALAQIGGGKGVFVKEIEDALLAGEIDLAVHSLKDLPTQLPQGLTLGAILPREDPRDVIVGPRPYSSLDDVPSGAVMATGSLRRTVQLRHLRPDLTIEPIRGNVDTRIRKMHEAGLGGVVLAAAGIRRLDLQKQISYTFSMDEMTPAVGQGALAIEVRQGDDGVLAHVEPLEDLEIRACVEAERELLDRMGGGCQVPLGAHGQISNGRASFQAFVASPTSTLLLREVATGPAEAIRDLGRQVTDTLLERGAARLLESVEGPEPATPSQVQP